MTRLPFQNSQLATETTARLGRRALVNLALVGAAVTALNLQALYSCAPPPGRTSAALEVTSFKAVVGQDANRPQLRLRFNVPAVNEAEVGQPLSEPPAKLLPQVPVEAHWADRQTLVLIPTGPLEEGKKYDVVLAGPLAERTRKVKFEFVNRPLKLLTVATEEPYSLDWLHSNPKLRLVFNRKVRASAVARSCYLTEHNAAFPIPLSTPEPGAAAKEITLSPRQSLPQAHYYALRCVGLKSLQGGAPLTVRYGRALRTHGHLAVAQVVPSRRNHPPEDTRIQVTFTTPVAEPEARRRIRLEPPVKGLEKGGMMYGHTSFAATLDLEPNTAYRVVVDGQLKDRFGQRLGRTVTHTFATGRPLARLRMESGIIALEAAAQGYPVWTRHMDAFSVTCAPVRTDQVAKLLTSSLEYDPWYNEKGIKDVPWAKLGLQPETVQLTYQDKPGEWQLHQLDLPKLCQGAVKGTQGASRSRRSGAAPHRGLYLAEVRSAQLRPHPDYTWRHRPRQRILASITDLGVLTKIGPASGLVWVTSLATGKPVAGARVTVQRTDGTLAHRGVTDAQGRLNLPGSTALLGPGKTQDESWTPGGRQRLIVFAQTRDDLAVVDGAWSDGIHLWSFGVNVDRSPAASRIRGFIQSDRGLYRPGETVHFKGLVRQVRLGALPQLPEERAVKVAVRDPRGQVVLEREVPISAFGGFSFELPIHPQARVGDYFANATLGAQTFRERFGVEAYRKVTFEVGARSVKPHVGPDEPLRLALEARYLFGAPVSNGRVTWSVRRRPHVLRFAGLDAFLFDDRAGPGHDPWGHHGSGGHTEHLTDGKTVLDQKGRTALVVTAGIPEARESDAPSAATKPGARRSPKPEDFVTTVTITDPADQSVSRSVVTTRHPTDHYVGIRTGDYVQTLGRPFEVGAVAVEPGGKRVATSGELQLSRVSWTCQWQGTWRAHRTCKSSEEVLWRSKVDIPASGEAVIHVSAQKPGEHLIRLVAKDGQNRHLAASTTVWVLGKGHTFSGDEDSGRMALVPSRKDYAPGDTAVLVPRTPLTGATALVTLERNGVMESFVTKLAGASEGIRIPLLARHAPNVYATVTLVTGRRGQKDRDRPRFQMGVVELPVTPREHRLKVTITPERARYEPGEPVRGTLRVTDHRGRPVRAEVSLSVADEGLLQLIAYQLPDPLRAFFAPWGIGVDSATNWNRIARLNDPNAQSRDSGADSGDGGGAAAPRVRSRFVSSAYWNPALVTNAGGEVAFAFDAPDNLTAFRLMAVAADRGHRFGKGNHRITITKELLIEPVLPRFLSSGDHAEIGAVVHNRTDRAGVAEVIASAEGLELGETRRQVTLAAGGSARVRFPASVPFTKEASVQMKVRFGARGDAFRVTLPVQRPLAYEARAILQGRMTESQGGTSGKAPLEANLSWTASVLPADSHLEVSVDRTGLGELREGLRYLVEYPYGCLEQTLSQFIPLAKVKDLASSLGFEELQGPRLEAFLAAGAEKVARHQQDNGLFGLWPGSETYPHISAFALYGLLEAKRAGVTVDEAVLTRGASALRSWANHKDRTLRPGGELSTMALAAHVLAELGAGDTGLNARLYEARHGLPTDGLAFLVRALFKSPASESMRTKALSDLLARVPSRDGLARAVDPSSSAYPAAQSHLYFASPVRSSAIALSAILVAAPESPRLPQLVEGLKADRITLGRWRNTQENLYALVALSDWARRQAKGSTQVTLSLGDRELASTTLVGAGVLTFKKPLSELSKGTLSLRIQGTAGYAARLVTARRAQHDRAVNRGFALRRTYVDPATGKPLTAFRAGQLVEVRVQVDSTVPRHWVAVVDRLPAGFEPVNPKLATSTTSSSASRAGSRPTYYQRPTWTYQELLDDQARAFADHLEAGTHLFSYLARATLPGEFTAAPAHAEEMYSPEVYGRGDTRRITVRP